MYLGIDLGSSSVKLTLLDVGTGKSTASLTYPKEELPIQAPQAGWAEQDPEMWWDNFIQAFQQLQKQFEIEPKAIKAVGISYQMHGLVLVDKNQQVLRPSIIWCDSRAAELGNQAFESLGEEYCLTHLLNSPGNFTASKLAWVKQNEPLIYSKIHKFMLPGDFLAMKLTGEITTTYTGLSEGVFWDFNNRKISEVLLSHYSISSDLLPEVVPSIGAGLKISSSVAEELNLSKDVQVAYRAGDQPNNAFSLNVLNPGEVAATAGTSGVIYAVTDQNVYDQKSRVNTFLHVNDSAEAARNGVLLCINGTAILYSWLKKMLNSGEGHLDYPHLNDLAESTPPGASGLHFYPFGNGAERIFENHIIGAHLLNMDFNRHQAKHVIRAGLEGIIYALNLGFEMLGEMKIPSETIRVGHSNLFLSRTFREIFANVTATPLELYDTDGSAGAARGAALGMGYYANAEEALASLKKLEVIEPDKASISKYKELFQSWKTQGNRLIYKTKIEHHA